MSDGGDYSMTNPMLEKVLERAIQSEEHSYEIYTHLAKTVERPETRKLLEGLAEQELAHKKMLESFDPAQAGTIDSAKIEDPKLSELLEPTALDPDATVQDVMLFAMKKEQSAHEFYRRMSEFSPNQPVKAMFDTLAAEELKHKTGLEKIYEDMFMPEN